MAASIAYLFWGLYWGPGFLETPVWCLLDMVSEFSFRVRAQHDES